MEYEDFLSLEESERETYFNSISKAPEELKDREIEIESYKKELEELKSNNSKLESDLKSTKELNFTLARKVDSKPAMTFEDALRGAFTNHKGGN